VAEKSDKDLTE
jgi:hypothetical protein